MVHTKRKRFHNRRGNKETKTTWSAEKREESYTPVVKENEKYWTFYRAQNLIPEDEFEEFRAALQRCLPVSFRFQGCHKDREQLENEMKVRFFKEIEASNDESLCVPKPIPWFKEAYQTSMPRSAVRSHPILTQLHNFLVTETELGNLSRQEAVSMIPPLLLSPSSEHYVLDMCAAPGSKTAQLIEMLHKDTPNPTGMVVANDLDKKRCYMLIRQTLKRFHTAACVVTCEDAVKFPPVVGKDGAKVEFDRVLCDVICSGDGTMRKNPGIWKTWSPQEGLGLHRLQLAIARRGAELLRVGGLMVYSTCSLNPIEDEAVVAQLLRESKGSLRLVDTTSMLPELKRLKGISSWKVFDREMREYKEPAEVDEKLAKMMCASCFPPTEDEAKTLNLDYAMRIAPHMNDTGGFFVALIEKVNETNFSDSTTGAPAWKKQKMFKDEPFSFLKKDDTRWDDIRLRTFYGITDTFSYENLFSRRLEGNDANARQLFYANEAVRNFVKENMKVFSIQNAGMKMFGRTEGKIESTRFRISQEGIRYLFPFLNKQKMEMPECDMLYMLKSENPLVQLEQLTCKNQIRKHVSGSLVVYCNEEDPVCTWVGYHTIAPYISKEERVHHLRMLGVDCADIEQLMRSKRKEKAAVDREAAWAARKEENEDGDVSSSTAHEAPKTETSPDAPQEDLFDDSEQVDSALNEI